MTMSHVPRTFPTLHSLLTCAALPGFSSWPFCTCRRTCPIHTSLPQMPTSVLRTWWQTHTWHLVTNPYMARSSKAFTGFVWVWFCGCCCNMACLWHPWCHHDTVSQEPSKSGLWLVTAHLTNPSLTGAARTGPLQGPTLSVRQLHLRVPQMPSMASPSVLCPASAQQTTLLKG